MDTKTQLMTAKGRAALPVQHKPHWAPLERGLHLGLYKGERGSKWVARMYVGAGRYEETTLGCVVGDEDAAPEKPALEIGDAMGEAKRWADFLRSDIAESRPKLPTPRHLPRGSRAPVGTPDAGVTVAQACDAYIAWLKAEGKAWEPVESMCRNHIHGTGAAWKDKTPEAQAIAREFAALPVAKVTPEALRAWHGSLARRNGDPEDERRSKDGANRILTSLKAALNRASGGKTAE